MIEDLIYDVGMNNGDDTAFYLARQYRVVAIEADPGLVAQASTRFAAELQQGKLVILNVGIAAHEGQAQFWVNDVNSVWNSFDRSIAARGNLPHHAIDIPCINFRTVLEKYGTPFYLKIDIEGNDFLCLDALSPDTRPAYVSVEMSELALLLQLRDLGYTQFKCIDQFHLLPLTLPPDKSYRRYRLSEYLLRTRFVPIRVLRKLYGRQNLRALLTGSRRQLGWSFPEGSSGPFGPQTPGNWKSWEEIATIWSHYTTHYQAERTKSEYGFWCDLHARKERPADHDG